MNKEENNFEEFLRSKLEDHTVEVSDSVWANIEKKQKKREYFIWFKQYLNLFIALDLVFITGLAVFSVLNLNDVQSQNNSTIAANQPLTKEVVIKSPKNEIKKTHPEVVNENSESAGIQVKQTGEIKKEINTGATTSQITNTIAPVKSAPKAINSTTQENNKVGIANAKSKENEKSTSVDLKQTSPLTFIEHNIDQRLNDYSIMIPILKPFIQNVAVKSGINENYIEPDVLSPSIQLTKSKQVLRREQRLLAKNEKQQALSSEKAQATDKNEKIETAQQEVNPNIEKSNSSADEPAPLALDTVYGKKTFNGYIAIDALFSPDLNGRSLSAGSQEVQNYITRRDSAEQIRIGYSALMRINLFINRNIFFNSGISLSQRKEKFSILHKWETHEPYIDSSKFVTYIDPFAGNIIYKTYDTLDYVRTHKDTLHHNLIMTFIDIPGMIGYKWLGKNAGFAIQGGVIFNLLFKQKGTIADFNYTASDVKNNPQQAYKTTTGLSLAGGITYNHKLGNNLDLIIEPHTRYMLKSINTPAYPLQQKLFTYGLNVGLRLKL